MSGNNQEQDLHQRIIFPFHAKNSAFLAHNLKQKGFDISVSTNPESKFKTTVATANHQDFNSLADLKINRFGVPAVSLNIDLNKSEVIKEEVFVAGKVRETDFGNGIIDKIENSGSVKGFVLNFSDKESYFSQKNELEDAKTGMAHKPFGTPEWVPNEKHHKQQLENLSGLGLGEFNKAGLVVDFPAISKMAEKDPEIFDSLSAGQLGTLQSACYVSMEADYAINAQRMHEDEAMASAEQSPAGRALPHVENRLNEKILKLEKALESHKERFEEKAAQRETNSQTKSQNNQHERSRDQETEAEA